MTRSSNSFLPSLSIIENRRDKRKGRRGSKPEKKGKKKLSNK